LHDLLYSSQNSSRALLKIKINQVAISFMIFISRFKLFTSAAEQNPESDNTGHFSMPAEIKENYVLCEDEGAKPLLLHCLLTKKAEKLSKKKGRICKTLCFASTKLAAHRLCLILKALSESSDTKLKVAEISADLRLMERNAILEKFTAGDIDV
jgi:superfamily II DNA/RNA helicase